MFLRKSSIFCQIVANSREWESLGGPGGALGSKSFIFNSVFCHSKSVFFDERVSPNAEKLKYFVRRLSSSKIFRGLFTQNDHLGTDARQKTYQKAKVFENCQKTCCCKSAENIKNTKESLSFSWKRGHISEASGEVIRCIWLHARVEKQSLYPGFLMFFAKIRSSRCEVIRRIGITIWDPEIMTLSQACYAEQHSHSFTKFTISS